MTTPQGSDPYVPRHGDLRYDVTHYDLRLSVSIDGNHLDALAFIDAVATTRTETINLDLHDLKVTKLVVDNQPVKKWTHRAGTVTIRPNKPLQPGQTFTMTVGYGGKPRPVPGVWGAAGWEELTDGVTVASQPQGAPSWFPCNDRSSSKASYRIRVSAPSAYRVVANGTLIGCTKQASRTTWTYDQPEPMAPYLASVQIGRYALRSMPGPIQLQILYPPALARGAETAFARQGEMVELFERRYGPYPYAAGYLVVVTQDSLEIPLEAQTLSIFGSNHLAPGWENERLVAHELAHQWFGNSLTVASWSDIWLHEGFACYSEWLWSEHSGRQSANEHADMHWRRLSRLPADLLLGDPGAARMFDDRVYKRGALTLHALRLTVGDAAFFELILEWSLAHRNGLVMTDAFLHLVRARAGLAAAELVDQWVWRRPLPALPR